MREIHRIINIAVIFMILGCWAGQGIVYSSDMFYLRVPMGIGKNRAAAILARDGGAGLPQGTPDSAFQPGTQTFSSHSQLVVAIEKLEGLRKAFSVSCQNGVYQLVIKGDIKGMNEQNDIYERERLQIYDGDVYFMTLPLLTLKELPAEITSDLNAFMQGEDLLVIGGGNYIREAEFLAEQYPGVRQIVLMDNDYRNTLENIKRLGELDEVYQNKIVIARDDILHSWQETGKFKAIYSNGTLATGLFIDARGSGLSRAWREVYRLLLPNGIVFGSFRIRNIPQDISPLFLYPYFYTLVTMDMTA